MARSRSEDGVPPSTVAFFAYLLTQARPPEPYIPLEIRFRVCLGYDRPSHCAIEHQ